MARFIWMNFIDHNPLDAIKDLYIPFNCKFFVVNKKEDPTWEITELYQIDLNSTKHFSLFATWENKSITILNKNIYSKRLDLKGRRLRVALSIVNIFFENVIVFCFFS